MIRDLQQSLPEQSHVADICIVGAGAAGIVLAVDLIRRGKSVLILEAGGPDIEEPSQDPYRSEVVGLRHNGIHTGRFRAKGGTTTRWGGQILELDAIDFEQRPNVDGSGWPIHKSELTPYYERALELEGIAAVTCNDADVWSEIGLATPQFANLESYFSRWCLEPNFARLHRQVLEENSGVDLWLHANAVEPILEGDAMRGLRCRTLSGREATFRANRFVFCLGAIESSRFFLQPWLNPLPWNSSGLLGKHYQDHIDVNAARVTPVNPAAFHRNFDNVFSRGFKYHPKLRLSPAVQAERGTLNVAATMNFVSAADETMGRIKSTAKNLLRGRVGDVTLPDVAFAIANAPLLAKQTYRYSVQHRAYNPPDAQIYLRLHCEQEPLGPSSITLSDQRDALGHLRTRLDWKISAHEVETMRTYIEVAQRSLAGVASLSPDPDLLSGDAAFLARCDDSNHHMGGMRMSNDPATGVVDTDLRLHALSNTYICSGAVFPTSGFSNPTHTLLALAVRLAEHLS
jgi:choline dehydrogenase-like flavoprotein